jgi:hypothetical protein
VTIEKKSLISTLNTTKKAIVASTPVAPAASTSEVRANTRKVSRKVSRKVARKVPRKMARKA